MDRRIKEQHLPIKAILAAIFCNVLFGSASPMIKLGYSYLHIEDVYSCILFAGIRFFLSGILVLGITACRQKKIPVIQKGNLKNVIWVALTYTFLQYLFFYIGLIHTTGTSATVVCASSSFLSVLLAHFLYQDDKLNLRKSVGSILGFSGVLVACLAGNVMGQFSFLGEGFILITALMFVIGSMLNKKASQKEDSFIITAYNLLVGGGLLILVGLAGYQGEMSLNPAGILVLFYLSLVSSLGFTIWSLLLRSYPIGKLGVFACVNPIAGTILSALLLGERVFNWRYLLALVLVSMGIVITNYCKNAISFQKQHT